MFREAKGCPGTRWSANWRGPGDFTSSEDSPSKAEKAVEEDVRVHLKGDKRGVPLSGGVTSFKVKSTNAAHHPPPMYSP